MPDATDDPKSACGPLDETSQVYSSLDAPPPPFQLRAPSSGGPREPAPAGRRLASHPANRSRSKPRVRPAAVRMASNAPAEMSAPEPVPDVDPDRPERMALDTSNPGVMLAVVVSLGVSAFVFLVAT